MLSSGSGICQICGKFYDRLAAHYIRSHGSRTFVPIGPPTDHAVPPLEEVIIDRDDYDDKGSDSGHHAGEADQSDNAAITNPAHPTPPTRQALAEQESLPTTAAFCRDDIGSLLAREFSSDEEEEDDDEEYLFHPDGDAPSSTLLDPYNIDTPSTPSHEQDKACPSSQELDSSPNSISSTSL